MSSLAIRQPPATTKATHIVNRSPLFGLPAEIRLLILKEYVSTLTHRTVKTADIRSYRRNATKLLSVSRRVLLEALPIVLGDLKSLQATFEERIETENKESKPRAMVTARNRKNVDRVGEILKWVDKVYDMLEIMLGVR